jgi:hypothetical protein
MTLEMNWKLLDSVPRPHRRERIEQRVGGMKNKYMHRSEKLMEEKSPIL